MIDLHAHVLPGIDDGPPDLKAALDLLRAMSAQGVTTVVAAAHALDGQYNATRDAVLAATEAVGLALETERIPLKVLPGMELYLTFDLLRALKTGKVMGLNGSNYVVVELPPREFPAYTERALFDLMIAGYRPILNHPERNLAIQKRPEYMYRLAERGVVAMVTGASLLGRFGATAEELARSFVAEEIAPYVVSDAHDLVRRAPLLPEGLAAAREAGKADQGEEEALLAKL